MSITPTSNDYIRWLTVFCSILASGGNAYGLPPAQAPLDSTTPVKPNAMIMLDNSGSMRTNNRLDSAKTAIEQLIKEIPGVNFCLSTFYLTERADSITGQVDKYSEGAEIFHQNGVLCGSSPEFKGFLETTVSGLGRRAYTPLAETYYDITRAFQGKGAYFGIPDAGLESPIEYRCQPNAVILIGDGESTHDWDGEQWEVETLEQQPDGKSLPDWDQIDGTYTTREDGTPFLHPVSGADLTGQPAYLSIFPYPKHSDGWLGGGDMTLDVHFLPPRIDWLSGWYYDRAVNYNKQIIEDGLPYDHKPLNPPYRDSLPCDYPIDYPATTPPVLPPGDIYPECNNSAYVAADIIDSRVRAYKKPTGAHSARIYIDDLALYGYETDFRKGGIDAAGKSFDGLDDPIEEDGSHRYAVQNLITHSIAIDLNGEPGEQPLRDAAEYGGGKYHNVDTSQGSTATTQHIKQLLTDSVAGLVKAFGVGAGATSSVFDLRNSETDEQSIIYFSTSYDALEWFGNVTRFEGKEQANGSGGYTLEYTQQWSAAEEMPPPNERNIFTQNNGTVVNFTTDSLSLSETAGGFSAAQKNALGVDIFEQQKTILHLRGDDTPMDDTNYRIRSRQDYSEDIAPLGDIVNSTLIYTQSEAFPHPRDLTDVTNTSYVDYVGTKAGRNAMLYVGANDGMLHAFDAGSGKETFAFIPGDYSQNPQDVFYNLKSLTEHSYSHRYFVDGKLQAIDVQLDGRWTSVLGGTLGAGGKGLFLLDISNPTGTPEQIFRWEAHAPPASETNAHEHPYYHLGHVYSDIRIFPVRKSESDGPPTHSNTRWLMAIGNGTDSAEDKPVVFIIDLDTGAPVQTIELTKEGESTTEEDGVMAINPIDRNQDGFVDHIYAGTLRGEIWRLNLTEPADGGDYEFDDGQRIFIAENTTDINGVSTTYRQPITGGITAAVGYIPDNLMLFFGTGAYFHSSHKQIPKVLEQQTFYAISDAISDAISSDTTSAPPEPIDPDDLITWTLSDEGNTRRINTDKSVGELFESYKGWKIHLPALGEKVIKPPLIYRNTILFATHMPPVGQFSGYTEANNNIQADACITGASGWLMRLDMFTGAPRFPNPDAASSNDQEENVAGIVDTSDAPNIPSMVIGEGNIYGITPPKDEFEDPESINFGAGGFQRTSWRILQ